MWDYNWTLIFSDGSELSRLDNNKLPKDKRIDPNNPYKTVKTVQLKGKIILSVDIPVGAKPVVHRLTKEHIGVSKDAKYRIGWNHKGVRIMMAVDSKNNTVTQEMDYVY